MRCPKCAAALAFALFTTLCAPAQDDPGAVQPRAPGPFAIAGLVDVYGTVNFNHPASRTNQLRNFDVRADGFGLNMAKVTVERAPSPLGFRLDLGFGRAFKIVHTAETGPALSRNIEQAFVSYKAESARGLQLDFGKFVTSAGAEVIETNANWNYSRSLLFAYAIPYFHFGLRAGMPVYGPFSAGVQIVNGWNNLEDNNSAKTVGLVGVLAMPRLTWSQTYYTGREQTSGYGSRRLYDTTLLLAPVPWMNAYINVDYGRERQPGGAAAGWTGIAGAARLGILRRLGVATRTEWFRDADGFATGLAQTLKEVTLTADFAWMPALLSRLEYRRDWSNRPYFDRGATPGALRHQDTLLAGLIASFGFKR